MSLIVILKPGSTDETIDRVCGRIRELGLAPHIARGDLRTVIGAFGDEAVLKQDKLEQIDGVESVTPITKPYKLASRDFHAADTVIEVRNVKIGGSHAAIIAGPCAIESRDLLFEVAGWVKKAGAAILRGGAFKPRTSPYAFQGMGFDGLKLLREAGDEFDMPVITEVIDSRDVSRVADYTDILQVGARNMQNYHLLMEVGRTDKPVFLKRGLSATVQELLMSAEYVMSEGNHRVILCERGIRTFETSTRFTLDIAAVPVLRRECHLPVYVDPSHAAGKRDFVADLARAGLAAGAHGVIVEVHTNPDKALCDGPQALLPVEFTTLMQQLQHIATVCGKSLS
ncbi:MAG: 3-deoxy-7-phosphoheptulonate synthase [Phycisphaerales bacterium]|nr:MAG: 3-deoxy-7-phosphoheptulonate synthase [Phycisphaerales bacterium]